MTIKGMIHEKAGFIEEELGEMLGSKKMMTEGRKLRNKGKRENGKRPKTTKPGSR